MSLGYFRRHTIGYKVLMTPVASACTIGQRTGYRTSLIIRGENLLSWKEWQKNRVALRA